MRLDLGETRYLRAVERRGVAALAVLVGAMGFSTDAGVTPQAAEAGHPCFIPQLRLSLEGTAVVGSIATFRYRGDDMRRIDWGDGSIIGYRRVVRGRLRHRFRRAGKLTVTVVQLRRGCCASDHSGCASDETVRHTLDVRVRRRS